ncbi:hypothetical protein ABB02_00369 [Clostridiaceae bacterium JG1575]|nr:hypothetical protein ABB02_00369 [Clostridiaceae bacterium JG1575]
MKRIFELTPTESLSLSGRDLLNVIRQSEGRTVLSETVVLGSPLAEGVSNPEMAAACGADLITLNRFSFTAPLIFGWDDRAYSPWDVSALAMHLAKAALAHRSSKTYLSDYRTLVGVPLGVNLEPVPQGTTYPKGFTLNAANLEAVQRFGFDYLVLTANPMTGVRTEDLIEGVRMARSALGKDFLIMAGKMHGAGTGVDHSPAVAKELAAAGADVLLLPAPYTLGGYDELRVFEMIAAIHETGCLAMTCIGTSQEGASPEVIQKIALFAKGAGADIQHIGDAGQSGMALPENLLMLSETLRGRRHTLRKIGSRRR